ERRRLLRHIPHHYRPGRSSSRPGLPLVNVGTEDVDLRIAVTNLQALPCRSRHMNRALPATAHSWYASGPSRQYQTQRIYALTPRTGPPSPQPPTPGPLSVIIDDPGGDGPGPK